jgi:hypothetical protein
VTFGPSKDCSKMTLWRSKSDADRLCEDIDAVQNRRSPLIELDFCLLPVPVKAWLLEQQLKRRDLMHFESKDEPDFFGSETFGPTVTGHPRCVMRRTMTGT